MRTVFRLTALLVALVTLALWWRGGFDRGWTKTRVRHAPPKTEMPDLTEPAWVRKFVPGVDFLAGGALAATLLLGSSFFCRPEAAEVAAESAPVS